MIPKPELAFCGQRINIDLQNIGKRAIAPRRLVDPIFLEKDSMTPIRVFVT